MLDKAVVLRYNASMISKWNVKQLHRVTLDIETDGHFDVSEVQTIIGNMLQGGFPHTMRLVSNEVMQISEMCGGSFICYDISRRAPDSGEQRHNGVDVCTPWTEHADRSREEHLFS